jgi:creatinine amidohydrolase/Fe(II)-dependent formamide hydrolase-like protein
MTSIHNGDGPTLLRWETLTKKKFDQLDREKCVVMVTCSPLEVHGPHLPFGADILEGQGLAQRTLQYLPEPHRSRIFLQLPPVYAATDTVPQPGSLFFRPSTTMAVLKDLGRSLAAQGFKDIVVSNFHGSPRHFVAIERACDTVTRERNVRMVCLFSVLVGRLTGGTSELYDVLGKLPGIDPEDLKGDTHGGLVETSQLLALHPEWVERDYNTLPRRTVEIWLEEQGKQAPKIDYSDKFSRLEKIKAFVAMFKAFQGGVRFFREESYSGTPGKASAELGERILDVLCTHAAAAMTEILEGKLPPDQWHSPVWRQRFLFTNRFMVWFFNRILGIEKGVA